MTPTEGQDVQPATPTEGTEGRRYCFTCGFTRSNSDHHIGKTTLYHPFTTGPTPGTSDSVRAEAWPIVGKAMAAAEMQKGVGLAGVVAVDAIEALVQRRVSEAVAEYRQDNPAKTRMDFFSTKAGEAWR